MKKIITKAVCLLCAGALVLGVAGCSKSADSSSAASSTAAAVYGSAEDYDYENFSYSSGLDENGYWEGVKALDYVTLPENFASLTFKRSEIEPTEEELQSEIDSLLSDHATEKQVTDRAAADGDTVNIDYAGSVDGVAFSGGTYSGYSLTLGSGTFIDGFEDQIVGHTPGETFDVTVTFPEGYSDSTDSEGNTVVLSGKKAVFSVTLNYISEKVLPELTDAWVAENYGESDDVHTVEELKALYQKMLYNTNLQNAIMDDLLANSTFKELPKEDIVVSLNASLFEWVIENLCKNAVDAMGGGQGTITIHVEETETKAILDVTDTGKGIRKKDIGNVFRPGFTTKKRGWGLGLSLAKRIVEEYHHGRIYVRSSEVGKGTTFRIELRK